MLLFGTHTTTKLSATITADQTIVAVTAGSALPATTGDDYFYLDIVAETGYETVRVVARAGNMLTVVRGVGETTPRGFEVGTQCGMRASPAVLSDILHHAVWGNIGGDLANQTDVTTAIGNVATTLGSHLHDDRYSLLGHTHDTITNLNPLVDAEIDAHLRAGTNVSFGLLGGKLVISARGSDNAGDLTSGTLPDARLSSNVPLRTTDQQITGTWSFTNIVAENLRVASLGGTSGMTVGSPTLAQTSYYSLLCSGYNNNFDVRFSATGGSSGVNGTGNLEIAANSIVIGSKTVYSAAVGVSADVLAGFSAEFYHRTRFI